jgi:hypothetical protein
MERTARFCHSRFGPCSTQAPTVASKLEQGFSTYLPKLGPLCGSTHVVVVEGSVGEERTKHYHSY